MILIADSGSSKTDWRVIKDGVCVKQIATTGMNPYFQTEDEIRTEINSALFPLVSGYPINQVFFYGAGCAFPEKNQMVGNVLLSKFGVPVEVYSDLMGAARSLCGLEPGIACILGTGSNSCLFDGVEIVEHVSPLGFILGDEGGGAVLGKLLVSDCLKHRLPEYLCKKFMEQYGLTPALILERVYKQPFPNRFLASFSGFLSENIGETSIYNLVRSSFESFFVRNVMYYRGSDVYPIHFTGSVAFCFREILKDVALSLDLNLGTVTQTPMEGLVLYHS